jgi:uncharacterized protein (DUF302 family)
MSRIIVIPASLSYSEAMSRLLAAIESRGLEVFARIDHAAGARAAGLELPNEEVVIFGNPVAGTPLMRRDPRVGIELPLRMLVWQDPDGARLAYSDPRDLAGVYDLAGNEQTLDRMCQQLADLAAAAASAD